MIDKSVSFNLEWKFYKDSKGEMVKAVLNPYEQLSGYNFYKDLNFTYRWLAEKGEMVVQNKDGTIEVWSVDSFSKEFNECPPPISKDPKIFRASQIPLE